jgi:hypothetical protein
VWKKGKRVGFEVDIRFAYPDGIPFRRRIKAPVESKSAARESAIRLLNGSHFFGEIVETAHSAVTEA